MVEVFTITYEYLVLDKVVLIVFKFVLTNLFKLS